MLPQDETTILNQQYRLSQLMEQAAHRLGQAEKRLEAIEREQTQFRQAASRFVESMLQGFGATWEDVERESKSSNT